LTIEKILRDAAAADKNFTAVALRYFNPIGADPSGLIGEKPSGTPLNLAPFVADVAAGTRPFVGVFGNDWPTPDGTGIRDYIHVCDLAAGHAAAADFAAKKKNTGFHVFNLGTGKGTSVLEMINAFKAACGHAIPIKFLPRRAGDIAASYADCKKAKRVLGWRATRSISEMCDSMWNFRNCVKDRVLGKKD
jgi:UDP-glucose 4-epimerase